MSRRGYLCQFPSANRTIVLVLCRREDEICCDKGCCQLREYYKIELWETWYFWFGLILLLLFVLTSVISYLVTSHRQKQCQVIHIRNLGHLPPPAALITTITGPGGIIQPHVHYQNEVIVKDNTKKRNKKSKKEGRMAPKDEKKEPPDKEISEAQKVAQGDENDETTFGPLSPAYPVFQPLWSYNGKGIKFQEDGFYTQGANVVEVSLPPGYVSNVDYGNSKANLRNTHHSSPECGTSSRTQVPSTSCANIGGNNENDNNQDHG